MLGKLIILLLQTEHFRLKVGLEFGLNPLEFGVSEAASINADPCDFRHRGTPGLVVAFRLGADKSTVLTDQCGSYCLLARLSCLVLIV